MYPKQEKAVFNDARFSVILGSTKCGKTISCCIWLFEQAAMGKRNQIYWWLAPSSDQASIAFREMKRIFPANLFKVNETNKTLTLPNETVIKFKSAEILDNLYGEAVYGVVLDESSRCRPDVWAVIGSVTTVTKAKVRLIGNVVTRDWFYNLYLKHKDNPTSRYESHSITAWDAVEAGVVDQEEIEYKRQELSDQMFKALYENIPIATSSNPFGISHIIDACTINGKPRELSQNEVVCFGVDIARSVDFTAVTGLDSFGSVAFFDRFQLGSWELTMNKILQIVKNKPVTVDSTGTGDAPFELMAKGRSNFHPYNYTNDSKFKLMEKLAVGIQNGQIRFPGNSILQTELEAFEYKFENHRVKYYSPITDDCVNSLALAFEEFTKPQGDTIEFY